MCTTERENKEKAEGRTMKNISEYTEQETRNAYEGIKIALTANSSQPITIEFLLKSMSEVKARAEELKITL